VFIVTLLVFGLLLHHALANNKLTVAMAPHSNDGWRGPATCRYGEAENPGPSGLPGSWGQSQSEPPCRNILDVGAGSDGVDSAKTEVAIITANVMSVRNKAETIASWDSDLTLLQETKLTSVAVNEVRPKFRAHHKRLIHGKPCRVIQRNASHVASAARESAKGGVAVVVREPRTPINVAQTTLTRELRETGRWEETVLLARADTSHFGAATLYGVSGASNNPRLHRQNEALISKAILRLVEFGDAPYVIAGDFNVEALESEAVASAIEAGIVIDVGHAARSGEEPELTYRRKGPFRGMSREDGTASRIDYILANASAAAAITSFKLRWDLVVSDHVPLEVRLDIGQFTQHVAVHDAPTPIDVTGIPELDQQVKSDAYKRAKRMYNQDWEEAVTNADVDQAHETWSKMAETYIEVLRGSSPEDARRQIDARQNRTAIPKFKLRRITPPTGKNAELTSLRQRQLHNLKNLCVEAKARINKCEAHNPGRHWYDLHEDHIDRVAVSSIWAKV
jgi:exonuclease III